MKIFLDDIPKLLQLLDPDSWWKSLDFYFLTSINIECKISCVISNPTFEANLIHHRPFVLRGYGEA